MKRLVAPEPIGNDSSVLTWPAVGPDQPYLSVVIPIHDEEESIPYLYQRLTTVLSEMGYTYELIAVDDGSQDRSFALLRDLARNDRRLRVVRLRRNFGQTAGFAAGFERARGQVVVTIDADLQNDPADIPALLEKLSQGYDVVSGWRKNRQDAYWSRLLPSMIANRLISAVTGLRLHDYGCSLKLYRREVVRDLQLYGEMHRFLPAIASWQGVAVAEMPVRHEARKFGRSKYGISRTFRVILDLLTVRFLLDYANRPMHVFGSIGLVLGLLGALILGYLGFVRLVLLDPIGGRPVIYLGVLLTVLAVQFISLGLVGELIIRMSHGSQRGAIYRVREELNGEPQASE
ncbi:MAG TPA: glycosyltransferase family 2 protein [Roseiflexaceae bacterium]|nr:glycosyltransferase family 2 protein [Roseiflexaceae bacterium]